MKLNEVIHKKRAAAQRSAQASMPDRPRIESEIERVFKWSARLLTAGGGDEGWVLDIVVPRDISEDDFNFTEGMLQRKLPSLVKKFLGDQYAPGEFRHIHPMMKALPGQKIQRGLPKKIRVPIWYPNPD